MKSTFIYLVILVTICSNSILAKDLTNKQNYQESDSSEMTFLSLSNYTKLKKTVLALKSNTIITLINTGSPIGVT